MWGGEAKALRLDDGSEHVSQKFRQWADDYGIELQFIQPASPPKMRTWNDSIVQSGKSS